MQRKVNFVFLLTLYFDYFFVLYTLHIRYVFIGKEKCNQCNILKNLLDEKGIRYHYLDMLEMPHKTMTFLKMYCRRYPMELSNYFSTFNETSEHFNKT